MPRDAGGNYSLPNGNPVVPGSIIEADWANTTMPDIGVALTDSLSRTGAGGMLVPFLNADGAVSVPGMSWANDPNSGFYRTTTGMFASWKGVAKMQWNNSGVFIGTDRVATVADIAGNEAFAIAVAIALG